MKPPPSTFVRVVVVNCCQWPGGCTRPKRPGRGARYCWPHERVAKSVEARRKRKAAGEIRRGLTGGPEDAYAEKELEQYAVRVRATLRAFGIGRL